MTKDDWAEIAASAEGEIEALNAKLCEQKNRLRVARLKMIEAASGFRAGMDVMIGGQRALIESIDTGFSSISDNNPWAAVRYYRKDGQPAGRIHNIFGLQSAGATIIQKEAA